MLAKALKVSAVTTDSICHLLTLPALMAYKKLSIRRGKQSVRLYAERIRTAQRHNFRAEARTHLTKIQMREGDFIRKKSNAIAFRVTDTDEKNIRAKAKKSGMNLTDYIVSSCLGKEIIIVNDISELLRELKAVGRNINQLTVLSNMKRIEVVDLKSVNENMVHIYSVLNDLLKKVS